MKIRDVITERNNPNEVGNETAKISRTAKQAAKNFADADKGAIENFDPKSLLAKVRAMYGVEIVDSFTDVLELPNGEKDTDKEMSMFSKDMRKK